MKKEETFHVTQLFWQAKVIDDVEVEEDGVASSNNTDNNQLFNP